VLGFLIKNFWLHTLTSTTLKRKPFDDDMEYVTPSFNCFALR